MALFDSHCHLDAPALEPDRDDVIARAIERGVDGVLVPAVSPDRWDALAALRARWSAVRIAIGVHPYVLASCAVDDALATMEARAKALGAVAIGECGFDRRVAIDLARQSEIVDAHVEIARALEKPIVLHVVGAHGLALERMERHGPLRAGGVVHAWSGPAELVARWVALGFSIGIGPVVTWARARRVKESARVVPIERLLVETDAPDGHLEGATRGEPSDVDEVVRAVAAEREVGAQELRVATWANAIRLFRRA
ncbi:TatD family hydrolase [Sandaracinus amylolyticus]|uniref:TatD family hydrolase n=1 Tax=Sandaracinus amylolyticus TaxID=927083 RepID=UPI001F34DB4F|nr:TatD family hydrolase [Sandaracinus amylolyticus]